MLMTDQLSMLKDELYIRNKSAQFVNVIDQCVNFVWIVMSGFTFLRILNPLNFGGLRVTDACHSARKRQDEQAPVPL